MEKNKLKKVCCARQVFYRVVVKYIFVVVFVYLLFKLCMCSLYIVLFLQEKIL